MDSSDNGSGQPIVVITGASRGIGAATARLFLDCGWTTIVTARSREALRPLIEAGAHPVTLDLGDSEGIIATAEQILRIGTPDVLVNNAGCGLPGPLEEIDDAAARHQLQTNVIGPLTLTRALVPAMRGRGGSGGCQRGCRETGRLRTGSAVAGPSEPRVVMVTSVLSSLHQPMSGWYCASKAALSSLTDTLRLELRGTGQVLNAGQGDGAGAGGGAGRVRVIEIQPGPVHTGWQAREATQLREVTAGGAYQRWAEAIARRTEARGPKGAAPEEVARAILLAASARHPRSRYVVGPGVRAARVVGALMPPRVLDAVLGAYFRP